MNGNETLCKQWYSTGLIDTLGIPSLPNLGGAQKAPWGRRLYGEAPGLGWVGVWQSGCMAEWAYGNVSVWQGCMAEPLGTNRPPGSY